jgi:Protein of unknown function (DUF2752)
VLAPLAAAGLLAAGMLAVVGLPPVDLHGPLHYLGVMDPLCGMTRGTVAVLRGRLGQAWAYNPASPLLVAGALLAVGRWLVGRLSGRWLDATLRPTRLTVGIAAALVLALWVNQQAHAALLADRPHPAPGQAFSPATACWTSPNGTCISSDTSRKRICPSRSMSQKEWVENGPMLPGRS